MKNSFPIARILVPVDRSDSSLVSQETAAFIAKKTQAEVTILHVIPSAVSYGKTESAEASSEIPSTIESKVLQARELEMTILESLFQEGQRIVAEAKALFAEEQIDAETEIVREHDPAEAILDYAEKFDLTIMAAHGESEKELFALGKVTKKVIRHTNCPTLIVKRASALLKILVAIDGSENSRNALSYSSKLAEKLGSKITILNVDDTHLPETSPTLAEELGNQILSDSLAAFGIVKSSVNQMSKFGQPSDVITKTAEEGQYDLIALGSRGLGKVKKFTFGSVSDSVSAKAKCSVLIVPPKK